MKNLIKYIVLFIAVTFLSLPSAHSATMSCGNYIIGFDHAGVDKWHDQVYFDAAACEILGFLQTRNADAIFPVVSYTLYPALAFADREKGMDCARDCAIQELESNYPDSHLAIIKEWNVGGFMTYTIKIKLPELQPFWHKSTTYIVALENYIGDKMESTFSNLGSNLLAEVAGMQSFIDKFDDLNPEELLELNDFEQLNTTGFEFRVSEGSGSNLKQNNSSENSTGIINEYAKLEVREGPNDTYISFLDYATNLPSVTIGTITLDIAYVISSSTYGSTNEANFVNFLETTNNEVGIWLHLQQSLDIEIPDKLWIQSGINLSEVEYNTIVDEELTQSLSDWGVSIEVTGFKGDEHSESGSGWKWGEHLMNEHFESWFSSPSTEIYAASIGAGLLDGVLSSIEAIYNLGKGAVKAGGGFFKKTFNYFREVVELGIKEKSLIACHMKIAQDGAGLVYDMAKSAVKGVVATYEVLKNAYDIGLTGLTNQFSVLFDCVKDALTSWFGTLLSFTKEGGYQVGKIAFEALFAVFSGGASSAIAGSKHVTKIISYFKSFNFGEMGSILTTMLSSAQSVAKKGSAAAKKFFRCKILGKGCFVSDTPVLMANNYQNRFKISNAKSLAVAAAMPIIAVPIQEVQLLDYAVAHETVNEQNNLIASTDEDLYLGLIGEDPYTSDQQRQRDKYEINDSDWYSVSFERVDGTSKCHFALHDIWIKRQGYEAEKVVVLNLPEQGINGQFRVTAIKHIIPQKKPLEDAGDGYDWRPVTGLFEHQSNQVYEINFDNGEELGVTYQHPIFSVTAGDWKLAGELEIGEEVLTKSGDATVTSSVKKGGSETVYNLEVQELHNFLVGGSGVLVHNECWLGVKEMLGKNKFTRTDLIKKPGTKVDIDGPDASAIKSKHGKNKIEICYDDMGFPNFKEWVAKIADIPASFDIGEFTSNSSSTADKNAANAALSAATGFDFTQSGGVIDEITYVWHHHQDGRTMMLVPADINTGAGHIGGKSLAEKELQGIFPGPDEIDGYSKACK